MSDYNVLTEDVRNIVADLTISDYSHTSPEQGKRDAYIFGVKVSWYEDDEIYVKLRLLSGVIVVSFHPSERKLEHPYKNIGGRK